MSKVASLVINPEDRSESRVGFIGKDELGAVDRGGYRQMPLQWFFNSVGRCCNDFLKI